jgi:release factor glutamine methyltransferase
LEAEILLAHALGVSRIYLYTNINLEVDIDKHSYLKSVKRRENFVPIEYITNSVSFYSNEFYIKEGVLVPRPETEILIDMVLEKIPKHKINIAEIGVGSGVISIMLSKMIKNADFIATDISAKALEISRKNIELHGIKNITLIETNLLDGVDTNIDILVSNPPYISDDYEVLSPLKHEPKEALFGGIGGLEIIKKIINLVISRKIPLLVCEIGYDQQSDIRDFLENKRYKMIQFYKDLAGLDRGFILTL